MDYGICLLNCIALRREPADQSEMISQVLFGECFIVLGKENGWLLVHLDFDHYEGWVHQSQVRLLDEEMYQQLTEDNLHYLEDMVTFIDDEKGHLQLLSLGSSLPGYKAGKFGFDNLQFTLDGTVNSGRQDKRAIIHTAYKYLNSPFLWGGKTPFGIDCSGFTQMVYKINGHHLYRDAHQQASQGEVLSFIEESEPGDLAFFDNEDGEIVHAGILLADNHIIHCHGKVRIDRIDQSGIYNVDSHRHTHRLRVMKKVF